MLPALRRHRVGTLVTISSIWGFVSKPEHMMYSAVKATTESLTESYAGLLAPLGIRTMIVEPGGFTTKFPGNNIKADGGITEDYKQQITEWMNIVDAAGKDVTMVNGDPKRFGASVADAVEGRGLFENMWSEQDRGKALRVQLGSDCYALFGEKLEDLKSGYAKMANVAKSTDVGP
jgi:NAD(P)-dependent dehydrogenase (short-subunit alcohol dehydrogenase family)